ncbi:MAG: glycosyltransferase family 4 protein [Planctomycetota bacterium]|jgi:UDP-glucose:(heptosyl)LPS alpha-1,3-glucosyltransferase
MKNKVAIIIERADITLGGAERSVLELTGQLQALGFDVDILAAKGQADNSNIHILCPDSPGKRACFSTFEKALKKHLSQNHYDVIHSALPFPFAHIYQPRGGTYAESILRNAVSYRNKFLTHFKKMTAFANLRRTILLQAERKLCSGRDGPLILALSNYVAQQLKDHYRTPDRRITVIPNGIKTDRQIDTSQANKLRAKISAELKLKEEDNRAFFLFVANNFRLKGLAPLLKAMKLAAADTSPSRPYLIVAGRDKPHKYRLIAKKLGLSRKVIFLGHVPGIQNLLSVIDVAVLPTFYDPSSRYILEAIAAGKPVITTQFNGAADLFVHNRHGKVIDSPDDVSALAEAVRHFTDAENIQKTSQAIAADNLKENISINRVAEQLISVYKSILDGS